VTLKALLLNCTLKKSPAPCNTQALMDRVIAVLESLDVACETVRVVDHHVPFGVSSDMGEGDEWPAILEKILAADILILGTPIWFGVRGSVAQIVIERLDGTYNTPNVVGQYPLYKTAAGVVVTGNEDGAHDAAATTLFNLSHLGCTIPPNADTYWLGQRVQVPPSSRRRVGSIPTRRRPRAGWPTTSCIWRACSGSTRSPPRATRWRGGSSRGARPGSVGVRAPGTWVSEVSVHAGAAGA